MVTATQEVQYRYFDLRFDGERTISGTAMVYGDVARMPWGDKEKFESGAFGDVSNLDLIINAQHNRSAAVARTGGSGLEVTDSPSSLEIKAELDDEDTDGRNTLRKVRRKVLRGLSVEFLPIKNRIEGNLETGFTIVHEQAELRGFGIVDKPAYKQSTLREEQSMNQTEAQMQAIIKAAFEERDADATAKERNAQAMATAFEAALKRFSEAELPTAIQTVVDAALAKRDEEAEAARAGDDEGDAAGDDDKARAMKKKKKMAKGDNMPMDDEKDKAGMHPGKKREEEIEAEADARAELIISVRSLLPKDYETKGKTKHEILGSRRRRRGNRSRKAERRLPARQGGGHCGEARSRTDRPRRRRNSQAYRRRITQAGQPCPHDRKPPRNNCDEELMNDHCTANL